MIRVGVYAAASYMGGEAIRVSNEPSQVKVILAAGVNAAGAFHLTC